jgi:hypothetical protein
MADVSPQYYDIKVKVVRSGVKSYWLKVGFGTEFHNEFGGGIICTFDAVPPVWNGEFMITPAKKKANADR